MDSSSSATTTRMKVAAVNRICTAWRTYKARSSCGVGGVKEVPRRLPLTDPLTLEPIEGRPFYLISSQEPYVAHAFDARMLAEYFDASLMFENPCTREVLNRVEVSRLARHERVQRNSLLELYDNLDVAKKKLQEEQEFVSLLLETAEEEYDSIYLTICDSLEQFFDILSRLEKVGRDVGEEGVDDSFFTAKELRMLLTYYASVCFSNIDLPQLPSVDFRDKLKARINIIFEDYESAYILQSDDLDLLCNLATLIFYEELQRQLNRHIVAIMFPRLREMYNRCFNQIVRNPRLDCDAMHLHCKSLNHTIDKTLSKCESIFGIKSNCISLLRQFVCQIQKYYSPEAIQAARASYQATALH